MLEEEKEHSKELESRLAARPSEGAEVCVCCEQGGMVLVISLHLYTSCVWLEWRGRKEKIRIVVVRRVVERSLRNSMNSSRNTSNGNNSNNEDNDNRNDGEVMVVFMSLHITPYVFFCIAGVEI